MEYSECMFVSKRAEHCSTPGWGVSRVEWGQAAQTCAQPALPSLWPDPTGLASVPSPFVNLSAWMRKIAASVERSDADEEENFGLDDELLLSAGVGAGESTVTGQSSC